MCIGALSDESIAAYRREAPPNQKETEQQKRLREKVVAEEQAKLRELRELLDSKKLQIERYVRVASPARGTTLLSDNLDVFLSGLLSLASRMVGAVTRPAGGAVMSVFRRVVLEIADKRVDARAWSRASRRCSPTLRSARCWRARHAGRAWRCL